MELLVSLRLWDHVGKKPNKLLYIMLAHSVSFFVNAHRLIIIDDNI